MDDLKKKYQELDAPVRYAVLAGAGVVGLILLFKVLPAILGGLGLGLILLLLIGPYWIPTLIAFSRKHPSKGGVLALNLFLGWTFIGWVVAIVWALSDNSKRQASVVVNTHVATSPLAPTMPTAPLYQVGDVVGGQRFNGVAWVPLAATGPGELGQPMPSQLPPTRAANTADSLAPSTSHPRIIRSPLRTDPRLDLKGRLNELKLAMRRKTGLLLELEFACDRGAGAGRRCAGRRAPGDAERGRVAGLGCWGPAVGGPARWLG